MAITVSMHTMELQDFIFVDNTHEPTMGLCPFWKNGVPIRSSLWVNLTLALHFDGCDPAMQTYVRQTRLMLKRRLFKICNGQILTRRYRYTHIIEYRRHFLSKVVQILVKRVNSFSFPFFCCRQLCPRITKLIINLKSQWNNALMDSCNII